MYIQSSKQSGAFAPSADRFKSQEQEPETNPSEPQDKVVLTSENRETGGEFSRSSQADGLGMKGLLIAASVAGVGLFGGLLLAGAINGHSLPVTIQAATHWNAAQLPALMTSTQCATAAGLLTGGLLGGAGLGGYLSTRV